MKNVKKFWVFSLLGLLLLSFYPLYMGFSVILTMLRDGYVNYVDYPKYLIPYTPVSLAVILSVLLMPLLIKHLKKMAVFAASAFSLILFFITEFLFENMLIITETSQTTLESWQMYMCTMPADLYPTRTWTPIDVLVGEYSPTFKLHFYLISILLILAILNSIYGFAQMLFTGEKCRKKALIIQSVSAAVFLGLCILACFTAFYRGGELTVSPISAMLMCLFFLLFGITAGSYAGSFLLGKRKVLAIFLPSLTASLVTLAMYAGELFLLSGHLYRFGTGFFFSAIPGIVLAPIDILIILLSGGMMAVITSWMNKFHI